MEEAENYGRDTPAHGSAEEENGEQEADEEEEAGGEEEQEEEDGDEDEEAEAPTGKLIKIFRSVGYLLMDYTFLSPL